MNIKQKSKIKTRHNCSHFSHLLTQPNEKKKNRTKLPFQSESVHLRLTKQKSKSKKSSKKCLHSVHNSKSTKSIVKEIKKPSKQTIDFGIISFNEKAKLKQIILSKRQLQHSKMAHTLYKPEKSKDKAKKLKIEQEKSKPTSKKISRKTKETVEEHLEVLAKIGEGTFGEVYKVRYGDEIRALKKVYQDKNYKNRELEILEKVEHQFVLKVHRMYFEKEQGKIYLNIIMDYYECNLYELIKSNQSLMGIELKIIAYQLLKALSYLHSLNICHRDIKPQNILYNKGQVAVCDFGSAKQLHPNQKNIAYICSRCYRAPELIFGSTTYHCQIDIWAAACVLIEIMNGVPLFLGDDNIDQVVEIIKVMGTPSQDEILEMNPNYNLKENKFPMIKAKKISSVVKTVDYKMLDLLKEMLEYSPNKRISATQALAHSYFDQLRDPQQYHLLLMKYPFCQHFFTFTQAQLQQAPLKLKSKLVPAWLNSGQHHHSTITVQ